MKMDKDELVKILVEQNQRLIEITAIMTRHVENVERITESFVKAFPDGDPDGHRRYHETLIRDQVRRDEIRTAVISKTLSGIVWFCLCAASIACFQHFRETLFREQIPIFHQPAIERKTP